MQTKVNGKSSSVAKIYFTPNKKWWQFWRRKRVLKEGKDYEIANGRLVLAKCFKGKFKVAYEVNG